MFVTIASQDFARALIVRRFAVFGELSGGLSVVSLLSPRVYPHLSTMDDNGDMVMKIDFLYSTTCYKCCCWQTDAANPHLPVYGSPTKAPVQPQSNGSVDAVSFGSQIPFA